MYLDPIGSNNGNTGNFGIFSNISNICNIVYIGTRLIALSFIEPLLHTIWRKLSKLKILANKYINFSCA